MPLFGPFVVFASSLKRSWVSLVKVFSVSASFLVVVYVINYCFNWMPVLEQPQIQVKKLSLEATGRNASPCDASGYENSIWLFETKLDYPAPRALCAVESLSTQMPDWCVRFLIINLDGLQANNPNKSLAAELISLSENIRISTLRPKSLLADTPLRDVFENVKRSKHHIPHLSDLLRLAVMYKYGGIYVDLDMIAIRPLETWKENYFTRQFREGFIGSTIMKASRPFQDIFLRAMVAARRGYQRNLYPSLLDSFSRTVLTYCWKIGAGIRKYDTREHLTEKCGDWHILGFNGNGMCHNYKLYISDEQAVRSQFRYLQNENCTLVHFYSTYRSSRHRPINMNTEAHMFFSQLALKFCPFVAGSVTMF